MTMSHLEGALTWADAGMSVVPVLADGSKRPLGSWKDFQQAPASKARISKWFTVSPDFGVGLICGAVSGGLEMLEIEAARMDSVSLDKVESAMIDAGIIDEWDWLFSSSAGYCESTPSGGVHMLYRIHDHEVPGNTKIAMDPTGKITYAETRGEGGFVIVAPSCGTVHKSGDSWAVLTGSVGKVPTITWDKRNAIHAALKAALNERPEVTYTPPVPSLYDRSEGERPGDLYEADPSVTVYDILTRNGWKYLGNSRGQDQYVHPHSSDMTTQSAVTGHKGSPNLYAWSGLPQEGSYTKFALLAELEFNGDYSAAAKWLHTQGYGEQREDIDISDWFTSPDETAGVGAVVDAQTPAVEGPQEAAPKKVSKLLEHTETGVAELAVRRIGDRYRSVHEEKGWRAYADGLWTVSRRNEVGQDLQDLTLAVRNQARTELAEAEAGEDKDEIAAAKKFATFANAIRSDKGARGVMNRFGAQRKISASVDDFDADRNLLRVENGTIELDTMTFRGHHPSDMLTKGLNICHDPQAEAKEFLDYLDVVIPNPDYRSYLKRAAGMSLLAEMRDAAFFVLHGPTGCGKSVFLSIMSAVFGDYAATAAPGTFKASRGKGDDGYELHQLRGARFASMSETSEFAHLDEELIKRVTGGDMVTSRAPYQDFITWKPRFTMWMATNFKPNLNAGDGAIWRRVKLVEFPTSFYADGRTPDTGLTQRILDNELPGVLNWLLEGVDEYRRYGLADPGSMKEALDSHRADVDPVTQFINESVHEGLLVKDPQRNCTMTELYRMFSVWCVDNGVRALGKTRFGNRLDALGYSSRRGSGGIRYRDGLGANLEAGIVERQTPASRRW